MIVGIHQPDYIPYIGTYYIISKSERFVFLDDAQYSNSNMHNWNRIKTDKGEYRLKIPVEYRFGAPIMDVRTKDGLGWKENHLKLISRYYSKSLYFAEFYPVLKDLIMPAYPNLADMNINITKKIVELFGLDTSFSRASELNIYSKRVDRVIDICKYYKADIYISGHGAKNYQNSQTFENEDITLFYSDFLGVSYEQMWGDFIPNMSIIDYIFNHGYDWDYILNHYEKVTDM